MLPQGRQARREGRCIATGGSAIGLGEEGRCDPHAQGRSWLTLPGKRELVAQRRDRASNAIAWQAATIISARTEEVMRASNHVMAALAALLLLDGCACEPSSTQTLQSRVATSMDPARTCNRTASVEYLSNGARVRIPDTTLFVVGRTDLSACGQYAMASVVEAMLAPQVMLMVVEPSGAVNAPGAFLPRERAGTVTTFISNTGFAGTQPRVVVRPASGPPGDWGIVLAVADQP